MFPALRTDVRRRDLHSALAYCLLLNQSAGLSPPAVPKWFMMILLIPLQAFCPAEADAPRRSS